MSYGPDLPVCPRSEAVPLVHAEPQVAKGLPEGVENPPQSVWGIIQRLGPGLIIAGSIVGSGELIGTTKTGAQAGFWLLWLIVLGCVIKVFSQVELGRYAISSGLTTIRALDEVPGPRLRVNWILWYWAVMFLVGLAQLGGVLGGVGQALAITIPIRADLETLLFEQDAWDSLDASLRRRLELASWDDLAHVDPVVRENARRRIREQIRGVIGLRPYRRTWDDVIWAAVCTLMTIGLLAWGRYTTIQHVSTFLVAGFTAVTIFCVVAMQMQPAWAMSSGDLLDGLRFRLPPAGMLRQSALATALATFGIIGVGANELIAYPYWCLEKGYARFAGIRESSEAWVLRATGWMRVMRWDCLASMVIYTFATVAFYLLGAGVLHRQGLDPQGNQMICTLAKMYAPVFGVWAEWFFLFGALAVLYSTFFVANAGHARVAADAMEVFGLAGGSARVREAWVRGFSVGFPLFALGVYTFLPAPTVLILAGGVMQAIMLPMLGVAALYFRYRRIDPRLAPGRLWDVLLWISTGGLLVAGVSVAWVHLALWAW